MNCIHKSDYCLIPNRIFEEISKRKSISCSNENCHATASEEWYYQKTQRPYEKDIICQTCFTGGRDGEIICGNENCKKSTPYKWYFINTGDPRKIRCDLCYKKMRTERQNTSGIICGNKTCGVTTSAGWYHLRTGNPEDIRCSSCYNKVNRVACITLPLKKQKIDHPSIGSSSHLIDHSEIEAFRAVLSTDLRIAMAFPPQEEECKAALH